jgi:hypothetical protein
MAPHWDWDITALKKNGELVRSCVEFLHRNYTRASTAAAVDAIPGMDTLHSLIVHGRLGDISQNIQDVVLLHEITRMTSIMEMRIMHLRATFVPPVIGTMTHLHTLDLSSNLLSELPSAMSDMTSLRYMNLSANRFTLIPMSIPEGVVTLRMVDNMITHLPAFLFKRTALAVIDLGNNNLNGGVPSAIGNLQSLRALDLCYNKDLVSIPFTLFRATPLKWLNISCTSIKVVPAALHLLPVVYIHQWDRDIVFPPLYWHRWYHTRFPDKFQRMIRTFCMCNFRFLLPYLPREMLWAIFQYLLYEKE